jgi:serine protease
MWTGKVQKPEVIDGQYIVVFKPETPLWTRNAHIAALSGNMTVIAQHDIGTFHGYTAAVADDTVVAFIEKSPEVAYVEQDGYATVQQDCDIQQNLPAGLWGLYRINHRSLPIGNVYHFHDTTENTVRAYILDTGVLITHVDFDGRAIYGANFVDAVQPDQHGHGTHVASTVGGSMYGVLKNAVIVAVKVLGKNGSGTFTGIIQGIQWTTTDANKYRGVNPAVGNMSLGGGRNQGLNDAVDASSAQGVAWIVASGNSNADACNFSPASAPTALSVGATTNTDARASFSNWGRCQHIWAPGANVLGAWMTSNSATNTISGTSMASPHACGVVGTYLATQPATPPIPPATAFAAVRALGTQNVVTDGKEAQGTPNILAYARCQ